MIHGFCVDHRSLMGLDPVFAARGQWQRIYVDLPGMGKSSAGPVIDSADALAEAVAAFARDTFGKNRFAVLGNSFGGMIARYLAAEFGDQVLGLGLLCPVAVAEDSQRTVPHKTVLLEDVGLLASLPAVDAADYAELAVVQSASNWAGFRDHVLPGLRAFDQAAIDRISARYALSIEPEDRSPRFTGPTAILLGRQDHVVGFLDQIAIAGHYVRSTIAVLDRAGHNAHLDQPELIGTLLNEWLTRVEGSVQANKALALALTGPLSLAGSSTPRYNARPDHLGGVPRSFGRDIGGLVHDVDAPSCRILVACNKATGNLRRLGDNKQTAGAAGMEHFDAFDDEQRTHGCLRIVGVEHELNVGSRESESYGGVAFAPHLIATETVAIQCQ